MTVRSILRAVLGAVVLCAALALQSPARAAEYQTVDPQIQRSDAPTLQRVLVGAFPGKTAATLVCLERESANAPWREYAELGVVPAQIGRNGAGEKIKEGDGRTPVGEFAFGLIFGREAAPPDGVKLPYRQATNRDFWVDDPASPYYNQWIVSDVEPKESHEDLRFPDGDDPALRCYDLSLVLDYNFDPIIPGNSSAIFF
ncbi:MAG: hypothetical protein HUK22_06120, partial [Thermoguttaceae bacterium]|nr:hypothetical protein [Thermoguttaceae bacterium]